MSISNAFKHFKTITHHRHLVMKYCFKIGLVKQGLAHDLSKYSWAEFSTGVRFYQGDRSPNDMERRTLGYSVAWLHHKGRNKHHYEYWTDYVIKNGKGATGPVPMPRKYIAEMFCDRLAACHTYHKNDYKDSMALDYYLSSKPRMSIHEDTAADLEKLLYMSVEKGEEATLAYIKNVYLKEE